MRFAYKMILGGILLSMPVFGVVANSENSIYRVYIDDEMIGTLSDLEVYEEYRDDKINQYLKKYEMDDIIVPSNIRIEEELTHVNTENNDEDVLSIIDDMVKFKTKGYHVKVGDSSMCVENIGEVENEIIDILEVFVPQKELLELVQMTEIEPLNKEGQQIIGIKFEPKAEYISSVCNIDDIVSDDEIGNLILTGHKDIKHEVLLTNDQTLEKIAELNDFTLRELEMLNYKTINHSIPYVGQPFNVTKLKEDVQVELEREVVKKEVIHYQTEIIEDPNLPEGEKYTKDEGQDGVKLTTYIETEINGELIETVKESENVISDAHDRVIVKGTKAIPSRGTKDWKWPTTRSTITCGYLCYSGHYAIDIAGYIGQPIIAADNGVIISAGYDGGYGNCIVINHNNGYYTRYAHLSSINVNVGQVVAGGTTIGGLGNTGNSTGPHLHFEIRTNTASQPSYAPNPLSFY